MYTFGILVVIWGFGKEHLIIDHAQYMDTKLVDRVCNDINRSSPDVSIAKTIHIDTQAYS